MKHYTFILAVLFLTACVMPIQHTNNHSDQHEHSSQHEHSNQHEHSHRQAEVAAKGAEIMPFDLARTTHIFEKIDNGGLQQVITDDGDEEQIALIRQHLSEEADRFANGDFHDPSMIHGDEMPGLHELVTGADQLSIVYSDIDGGGQILYTTESTDLIDAIHHWFDAQLADHGRHASEHR
ncbi:MAG: aspartate carbamoyltransferase [Chloroflexota bacterium]